jgi:hypothetical protein
MELQDPILQAGFKLQKEIKLAVYFEKKNASDYGAQGK